MVLHVIYLLVEVYKKLWNDPPFLMGTLSVSTGPFSMAVLNYQRVAIKKAMQHYLTMENTIKNGGMMMHNDVQLMGFGDMTYATVNIKKTIEIHGFLVWI